MILESGLLPTTCCSVGVSTMIFFPVNFYLEGDREVGLGEEGHSQGTGDCRLEKGVCHLFAWTKEGRGEKHCAEDRGKYVGKTQISREIEKCS